MSAAEGNRGRDAEARHVAARLTGRLAGPRERARALRDLSAPLAALTGIPGLPDGAAIDGEPTPIEDPDAMRWARLEAKDKAEPVLFGIPAPLAVLAGTILMGGGAADAGDEPTALDWTLAEITVGALAASLSPPRSFTRWIDGPAASADCVAITLHADDQSFRIGLQAAPTTRARTPSVSGAPASAPSSSLPMQRVDLRVAATLDLAPRCLRDALSLQVGAVLPLAGGLDAIAVRHDGRSLLGGSLGHATGRLCVRVSGRTAPAPLFEALRPPAASAVRPAQARGGTTEREAHESEQEAPPGPARRAS